MDRIPVFYHPKMVADARSFSPSMGKAAALVAALRSNRNVEVRESRAAAINELCLAHDTHYVKGVLNCSRDNGFGNRSPEVAAALPYQTGSLLSAAEHVIRRDSEGVAMSPSAGFHHAHYDEGAGYCTFNGLLVTALSLLSRKLVRRVGILDMDQHFGDGTAQIIRDMELHDCVRHVSYPDANERTLRGLSVGVKSFVGCDVLLYQAGADCHVNDPLGGQLTTEQMARRDRTVFHTCREYRIPVVWNLAGGYQRDENDSPAPVLALHEQTMEQCIDIYLRNGAFRMPQEA